MNKGVFFHVLCAFCVILSSGSGEANSVRCVVSLFSLGGQPGAALEW